MLTAGFCVVIKFRIGWPFIHILNVKSAKSSLLH